MERVPAQTFSTNLFSYSPHTNLNLREQAWAACPCVSQTFVPACKRQYLLKKCIYGFLPGRQGRWLTICLNASPSLIEFEGPCKQKSDIVSRIWAIHRLLNQVLSPKTIGKAHFRKINTMFLNHLVCVLTTFRIGQLENLKTALLQTFFRTMRQYKSICSILILFVTPGTTRKNFLDR